MTYIVLTDQSWSLNCSTHRPDEPNRRLSTFKRYPAAGNVVKYIFSITKLFAEMFSDTVSELPNNDICFIRQFSLLWQIILPSIFKLLCMSHSCTLHIPVSVSPRHTLWRGVTIYPVTSTCSPDSGSNTSSKIFKDVCILLLGLQSVRTYAMNVQLLASQLLVETFISLLSLASFKKHQSNVSKFSSWRFEVRDHKL